MPGKKNVYRLSEVAPLPRDFTKRVIHAAENPNNKGVSKDGKYYTVYSDGVPNKSLGEDNKGTPTLADGVAITSGAPKSWFSGNPVPAHIVDDWIYNNLADGDGAIRAAYDSRFGNIINPNPSDTLSLAPRLGAAQVRYQQYRLGNNTDTVLDALASGSDTHLQTALYLAGKRNKGGTNRLARVLDAIGGNFYK